MKIEMIADELATALRRMVDHAKEQYPHFESERGQRDIEFAENALGKVSKEDNKFHQSDLSRGPCSSFSVCDVCGKQATTYVLGRHHISCGPHPSYCDDHIPPIEKRKS
jgi:hypothetical protein